MWWSGPAWPPERVILTDVLIHQNGDISILRIANEAEAAELRPSFVGVYQTIFSEPPYNEQFYPYEAEGVLARQLQTPDHITLLAVRGASVVGFGFGVPLSSRKDVAREVQGLLPIPHTFYLSELGILNRYRGRGLGGELVRQRLALVERKRFSHVLLRTSATRHAGYDMYLKLGFQDIGVYMEVPSRRTDGRVTTDRRLFLSQVL